MNNRFRDYLGCLDLDILLDHFVFPCMRFSRYICDARRASSGEYEIRTRDLLLARQALSQLSYTPKRFGSHLLSHAVSSVVPSAVSGLTIVFGMGTGVSLRRIATEIFHVLFMDTHN